MLHFLRVLFKKSLWIAGLAALAPHAFAVVDAAGSGTYNDATYTSAPADDFGFENVGLVYDSEDGFNTSGVYLGNGWMISAYHEVRNGSDNSSSTGFSFGGVSLDGNAYSVNASTAVRLTNNGTPTDLALFQLTTIPAGIPSLTIASTAPPANAPLVLMGNGINRADFLTYWSVDKSTSPWTWTESTSSNYSYYGYKQGSGQALRWGTNNLTGTATIDDGYGTVKTLYTTFDNNTGEAQAAPGDSGGAVFYKTGSGWELAGILVSTSGFSGQPPGSSVFGDQTSAADLSQYASQINAVIPEPPSAIQLTAGCMVLAGFARRFRR